MTYHECTSTDQNYISKWLVVCYENLSSIFKPIAKDGISKIPSHLIECSSSEAAC